jgi:hypothetical protein
MWYLSLGMPDEPTPSVTMPTVATPSSMKIKHRNAILYDAHKPTKRRRKEASRRDGVVRSHSEEHKPREVTRQRWWKADAECRDVFGDDA